MALSDRVLLRRFDPQADAAPFHALNADPEVIRYTGDPPFPDAAAARDFLAAYDHYDRHGFGRWALVLRDEDRFVGFCGLKRLAGPDSVDLGFRLERRLWGRGLATEAASLALSAGFGRFGLDRIIGRALPENAASRAVLAKLGFRRIRGVPAPPGGHGWREHDLTLAGFAAGPVLRRVRTEDLPALFAHQRDPEAVRMAAFTVPDPGDEAAFRARIARLLADPEVTLRVISLGAEAVGHIVSYAKDGDREVGFWLARSHWGRGLATASLRAFLCEQPDRPLAARAAADNAASRRVLTRCGFTEAREERGWAHGRGREVPEIVLRLAGPPS